MSIKDRISAEMGNPAGVTGIWIDDEPPTEMHEDRLSKRMAELESHIMVALVLLDRQGHALPAHLVAPVRRYGEMWDESWNR